MTINDNSITYIGYQYGMYTYFIEILKSITITLKKEGGWLTSVYHMYWCSIWAYPKYTCQFMFQKASIWNMDPGTKMYQMCGVIWYIIKNNWCFITAGSHDLTDISGLFVHYIQTGLESKGLFVSLPPRQTFSYIIMLSSCQVFFDISR